MNPSIDIQDTLSVAEAAALLGCSGQTVRERIKRGELLGYDVRGKTGKVWRVLRAGPLADVAKASEADITLSVKPVLEPKPGDDSRFGASLSQVPVTLPQPGVVEALGLLRDSLAREAQLQADNARLREQLAARPLQLAAPALGFWLALWARLSAGLGAGRAG